MSGVLLLWNYIRDTRLFPVSEVMLMAEVGPDFKEGENKCGPFFVTDTAGRDCHGKIAMAVFSTPILL